MEGRTCPGSLPSASLGVGSSRHLTLLLAAAEAQRPKCVILLTVGNDLCPRDFDLRQLADEFIALDLGREALGVARVWMLPIPPPPATGPGWGM